MRRTNVSVLAGTGFMAAFVAAISIGPNGLNGARGTEAATSDRIVIAQATPRSKKAPPRSRATLSFVIEGAAPGWPNGVPIGGGQANQDAAGPVPDMGSVSGPSGAFDSNPNW